MNLLNRARGSWPMNHSDSQRADNLHSHKLSLKTEKNKIKFPISKPTFFFFFFFFNFLNPWNQLTNTNPSRQTVISHYPHPQLTLLTVQLRLSPRPLIKGIQTAHNQFNTSSSTHKLHFPLPSHCIFLLREGANGFFSLDGFHHSACAFTHHLLFSPTLHRLLLWVPSGGGQGVGRPSCKRQQTLQWLGLWEQVQGRRLHP